ncbi:hypothetical protein LOTGIDRAFT_176399 [Lottia gigantea]|uniref:Uncharacterized protein n=1 Tax=Lottia gigantea TaxID=225164 RepID=V4AGJ5_LOTGI|nr:hypothetical protein LOTGIDRAFT_176399 [Lottia gigantea]ESP03164.1 hypothetical protein LOTGIDRAFT_176399 [Lottia gigantea]
MVLKFGKGGISTGSTLRLTNTAHIRRNGSTSCIYMHEIEDKTVDVKVAKFLESASVFYSLNKKGRWKLPEIIEEKIQSELPSADVKVTLMKLHKLHRKNNCIGYFTNKGSVKSVVPKKTKYVNRLSVVNVNRKPFRNRRRRRNREVEPDRNIADDNEIKYHIVYPTPSSSAVTHTNPQKIGHDVMLNTHNLGKTAVRSKCRKWRCIERDVRCDMDYTDYDAVDEDSGFDTIEEVHQSQKRSSFSEYFESALGRPSDIRIKTRRRPVKKLRKLRNKPMLHYLETQVMEVEEENSEFVYSRPPTTECQPVDVLISNQESNPDHLKTKYGDKVTFAQCEPRTFIIDITNEVFVRLRNLKLFTKLIYEDKVWEIGRVFVRLRNLKLFTKLIYEEKFLLDCEA